MGLFNNFLAYASTVVQNDEEKLIKFAELIYNIFNNKKINTEL